MHRSSDIKRTYQQVSYHTSQPLLGGKAKFSMPDTENIVNVVILWGNVKTECIGLPA